MAEKRYMNDKGEIVINAANVSCAFANCGKCPNSNRNNGMNIYCGKYFEVDPAAWMKNKGYREIFELENYTDKWCVMACANDSQSEMFAKFLDKNGMKWRDGHSYIDDQCWRSTNDVGTGFVFNQGVQCYPGCWSDFDEIIVLHFEDYVFKMEDKKMEKDLRKLIKPGYLLEDMEGTRYLATEYLDDGGVIRIGLVEDDKSFDHLNAYDTDLCYKGASVTDYDIIKIWGLARDPGYIDDVFTFVDEQHRDIIWEREKVKEMTVAEIEKELGYSIKVVK